MAPGAPPTVLIASQGRRESVMARRWSIGLSAGGMGLAHKDDGDGDDTGFAIGELALRYRLTRHLELEVSGGGGLEEHADSEDLQPSDLEIVSGTLAARWRFNPEARWNLFAMGGIGAAAITRHDATDEEREDATLPMVVAGLGIERRFRNFAVHAEVRGFGIGRHDDDDDDDVDVAARLAPGAPVTTEDPDTQLVGGRFTVGLSYYF